MIFIYLYIFVSLLSNLAFRGFDQIMCGHFDLHGKFKSELTYFLNAIFNSHAPFGNSKPRYLFRFEFRKRNKFFFFIVLKTFRND